MTIGVSPEPTQAFWKQAQWCASGQKRTTLVSSRGAWINLKTTRVTYTHMLYSTARRRLQFTCRFQSQQGSSAATLREHVDPSRRRGTPRGKVERQRTSGLSFAEWRSGCHAWTGRRTHVVRTVRAGRWRYHAACTDCRSEDPFFQATNLQQHRRSQKNWAKNGS